MIKKLFSIVFFVLTLAMLGYSFYFGIAGAIAVRDQYAELAASGASGHELLGVPIDLLVLGLAVLSVAGGSLALLSWRLARHRSIKIASGVACGLFLVPILASALIVTA